MRSQILVDAVKKVKLVLLSTIVALLLTANFAISAPLTYNFSGDITSVIDDNNVLDPYGVSVASTFTGNFTYDPVGPLISSSADIDRYQMPTFELNITIDGTWTFSRTAAVALVKNATLEDRFYLSHHSNYIGGAVSFPFPQNYPNVFAVQFLDTTGTVFSDTSLPTALDFTAFDSQVITIGNFDSSGEFRYQIHGSVNSVVAADVGPAPVPEPSTWLILSSGLVGLAWYGRKQKKS